MSAVGKDVDCLLIVKSVAINNLGIRRDCVHFLKCCRLLVVLTEGRDLCCLNRESWSRTCENGVQGVPFAGHCCASTSPDGMLTLTAKGIHAKVLTAL